MTSSIVLHPKTKSDFLSFVEHPSHAVVLYGPSGSGKTFVAEHLAAELLGVPYASLQNQAYYRKWRPDEKGTIKLEEAHAITAYMKLKTTGNTAIRRAVVIEHAECLTTDAQNALLKLIEEPPSDTVIILTAPSEKSLLATIRSRTQSFHVRTPSKSSLIDFYKSQIVDGQDSERVYLLSRGLPGLYHALVSDETEHPIVKMIQICKEILAYDTFTRLTVVDTYSSRQDTELLVNTLGQIARTGLAASAKRGQQSAIKKWHTILVAVQEAQQQLSSSGSPKLVLATLFLHM